MALADDELRRALATLRRLAEELDADRRAAGLGPDEQAAAERALAEARALADELQQVIDDDDDADPTPTRDDA